MLKDPDETGKTVEVKGDVRGLGRYSERGYLCLRPEEAWLRPAWSCHSSGPCATLGPCSLKREPERQPGSNAHLGKGAHGSAVRETPGRAALPLQTGLVKILKTTRMF